MAKTYEQKRIKFDDGRRGVQYVTVHEDGYRELTSIVVDRCADGTPCRKVCGPRAYYRDDVFSFADLGNVEWEIDE